MPITTEQLAERRKHLGSSDMAAVLGLDPWRSAEDVRLEKQGKLIDREATDVMNAGNWLEDGVLNFAQDRLARVIVRNPGTRFVEGTPLAANTDAIIQGTEEPIEAKTVKLFGPSDEWWGEEETDQVPDRVIIQCHVHMMAWVKDICYVPALIGGRGLMMYRVLLDGRIVRVIIEKAIEFWTKNVLGDTPVDGSRASLKVVKMIRRQPEKIAAIDPEKVRKWLDAKEVKEEATADLLAALGDAEAGMAGELGAVTYLQQTRKEHTVKASTFRVLRHKPTGL